MKQSQRAIALTLFCALLLLSVISVAQNSVQPFFGHSTLSKIISHRECTGVRFYNVVEPNTGKASVMAIGIRADKSEIVNLANRYYIFKAISPEGPDYNKLGSRKAAEACQKVKESGTSSFSASFTKEQLTNLMKSAPDGGLIVGQKKMESFTAFEARPGMLIENKVVPVENSEAMRSGEPCPTFCGNTRNYVHM